MNEDYGIIGWYSLNLCRLVKNDYVQNLKKNGGIMIIIQQY